MSQYQVRSGHDDSSVGIPADLGGLKKRVRADEVMTAADSDADSRQLAELLTALRAH